MIFKVISTIFSFWTLLFFFIFFLCLLSTLYIHLAKLFICSEFFLYLCIFSILVFFSLFITFSVSNIVCIIFHGSCYVTKPVKVILLFSFITFDYSLIYYLSFFYFYHIFVSSLFF